MTGDVSPKTLEANRTPIRIKKNRTESMTIPVKLIKKNPQNYIAAKQNWISSIRSTTSLSVLIEQNRQQNSF